MTAACAVCCWMECSSPQWEEVLARLLQAHAERIKAADSIVIIGGGPVGVELAGEIVSAFPGTPDPVSCPQRCTST